MELLVTLSDINYISVLASFGVDGVIAGSFASFRYHYSMDELKRINKECKENKLKLYISIDGFISQQDISTLYVYMEELNKMKVDGIYFSDFAVVSVAKTYGMEKLLIYDGGPMCSSSLDCAYYLNNGFNGVVLARELKMDEIINILEKYRYQVDMQVFGHLRMSVSKRKFLSNYFKQVDESFNPQDKETLVLKEEKRDYCLPIIENEDSTVIYTDYVLEAIEELPYLKNLLKRAIIDDIFIEPRVLHEVIRDYKRVTTTNSLRVKKHLYEVNDGVSFSNGYFYKENTDIEDEEN